MSEEQTTAEQRQRWSDARIVELEAANAELRVSFDSAVARNKTLETADASKYANEVATNDALRAEVERAHLDTATVMASGAEIQADRDALRERLGGQEALAAMRADGWAVAVHNDYRQDGEAHTFWLFTRERECVKGEGKTDAEAIQEAHAFLAREAGGAEGE